jgi:putative oxidoreductase
MGNVSYMAALGRLLMAALFLVSGFIHVLHLASPETAEAPIKLMLEPRAAFYIATAIEILGGIFLAIGLGTRYVALVLAVFMLVMAFGGSTISWDNFSHLLKNLAIAGGLIQVWSFGSGGLAVTHSNPAKR